LNEAGAKALLDEGRIPSDAVIPPQAIRGLLSDLEAYAPEVILLSTDRVGRVTSLNAAACAALDRTFPETPGAPGIPITELLAVADARSLGALLEAPPGRSGPRLVNFVGAAGSLFTVRAMVEAGAAGLVLAGIRTAGDETRLGDELVRLNNDLAAATRESARKGRELEKALAELRRAQSLLVHQEKMAALGQTTAGVAHEINNPLAFVLSNNETLGRDFEDLFGFVNAVGDCLDAIRQAVPAVAQAIDEAAEKAELEILAESVPRKLAASGEGLERIRQIVTDLRVFSRLDEADRKEVDLGESLAATVRFLGPLGRERGVQIETELPEKLRLLCSPGALNQAVSNILANAIQASRPGQTVGLRIRREAGVVRIRVEDHGSGIEMASLSKIFDPFFTTKPVGEGVGLGLSITHQVVAAHGGKIEVESEPGKGTVVTILLPAPEGEEA
jgi:signal transduction histidine kinase